MISLGDVVKTALGADIVAESNLCVLQVLEQNILLA
jgi:hypothetical protein